ncbi:NifU family protein [Crassaminicella thermophila]|uniref:NifU family protein n=1 Tax=Crassaminicella thermophila TaxID=2599308 RepID=A0A5C0SEZ6_CRATE|nr:NifU family protein [Crassaminicella thermophila]QEK12512.1 NifU family protein [Crassaminicella thermophila]
MFDKVNEVIQKKIRPKLAMHFGDIELVKVEDGVVEVKLLGACSGCPSARFTLEDIVLTDLQEEIPEVKEVALVSEVSQELIDMAKKILKKDK